MHATCKAVVGGALIAAIGFVSASCAGGNGATTAPQPSAAPTRVSAAPTQAATTAPVSSIATVPPTAAAVSPGASIACIDAGDFADSADPVVNVMTGLMAALKVPSVSEARTDAETAEAGLKRLADLVTAAQPAAATDFRNAASELTSAQAKFPDGMAAVDQAQANLTAGLQLARTVDCSS
jgi:hypothetical protein